MERFTLSPTMIERLRAVQAEQMARYNDPFLRSEDAVVATYGLGSPLYLCLDGRVLRHDEDDPAPVQITEEYYAHATLLILIKHRALTELLELFPPKPAQASLCQMCGGTRWLPQISVVCMPCRGRGWVMDAEQAQTSPDDAEKHDY